MADTATKLATKLLAVLSGDEERLTLIDNYLHGKQADPYMPPNASAEYRLLAKRAVSNWMPLLVDTPCQALAVDGFRRSGETEALPDEWKDWQRSRMDARQVAVHRGAVGYGHSFVVTERDARGRVNFRGLSPLRTAALFADPANDDAPQAALTITRKGTTANGGYVAGAAVLWDSTHRYEVVLGADGPKVGEGVPHGNSECPVTRFAPAVDLDGRTVGVVEPMIPLQDRINQSVFDLLVAQTFGSFKVRYATGMAPPLKRDPETGEPELDADGNPIPLKIDHNAARMLFGEDADTKFGTLDETPLAGFIDSIDMSIRHLASVSQTPPHHLLGQIANISAEALAAAETALSRKVEEFRKTFGESWERVLRLGAELRGDAARAEDYSGEIVWRDMEQRSLAQSADALGKMRENLGIPARGLWPRVPGVTQSEIKFWTDLADEEDSEGQLARAFLAANSGVEPIGGDIEEEPVEAAA